jgi:hypothetical protein
VTGIGISPGIRCADAEETRVPHPLFPKIAAGIKFRDWRYRERASCSIARPGIEELEA